MRYFKADKELSDILFNNGFIETSFEDDKLKGKRRFKLSKNAQMTIYFNYINISIIKDNTIFNDMTKISEENLKLFLLYFKLSTSDLKTINPFNDFDLKKTKDMLSYLSEELERLKKLNIYRNKQNKIKRILDTYNNISFS